MYTFTLILFNDKSPGDNWTSYLGTSICGHMYRRLLVEQKDTYRYVSLIKNLQNEEVYIYGGNITTFVCY